MNRAEMLVVVCGVPVAGRGGTVSKRQNEASMSGAVVAFG